MSLISNLHRPGRALPARRWPLTTAALVAALLAGGFTAGLPSRGFGERPIAPKLLPENTAVFVRVANSQELFKRWRETSIGQMAQDEQLRPLIKQLYGSLVDALASVEKEVGVSLDDVLSMPQGEVCFALLLQDGGPPAVVAYVDCGEELETAKKLFQRGVEEAVDNNRPVREETHAGVTLTVIGGGQRAATVFFKDSTAAVVMGPELAKNVIDVWDGKIKDVKTLADNQNFVTIMGQCSGTPEARPDVYFYADPIGLVGAAIRGNFTAQATMALLSPLGIYNIKGVGGSLILPPDDYEMIVHAHLAIEQPRKGLLNTIALKQGSPEPPPWVPAEVVSYSSIYWDINQTLNAVDKIVATFRGEGALKKWVEEQLSRRLKVEVQKDILDQTSGRFVIVTWMEPVIRLNSQCTLVAAKIRNPEQMRDTLRTIAREFPDVVAPVAFDGNSYYRLPTNSRGSRRRARQRAQLEEQRAEGAAPANRVVTPGESLIREATPSLGVIGDYVVICDSELFFQACLRARKGESLKDDVQYKLIEKMVARDLEEANPGLFEFRRPEESFRAVYSMANSEDVRGWLKENQNNPFFGSVYRALEENPLPPFEVIAKYLAPGGAMAVDNETGLHYMSFGLRRQATEAVDEGGAKKKGAEK